MDSVLLYFPGDLKIIEPFLLRSTGTRQTGAKKWGTMVKSLMKLKHFDKSLLVDVKDYCIFYRQSKNSRTLPALLNRQPWQQAGAQKRGTMVKS